MSPRCPPNPPSSYRYALGSDASSRDDFPSSDRNRRAFPINVFCKRYGIGRSKAYDEIKAGRLTGVKSGRRTLIREEDAEKWLRSLPKISSAGNVDGAAVASDCLPSNTRCNVARNPTPRTLIHRHDGAR
ncbi:MAG: helix-turn-helix domain-containing protein [Xanthobacteraceae bacterium]